MIRTLQLKLITMTVLNLIFKVLKFLRRRFDYKSTVIRFISEVEELILLDDTSGLVPPSKRRVLEDRLWLSRVDTEVRESNIMLFCPV